MIEITIYAIIAFIFALCMSFWCGYSEDSPDPWFVFLISIIWPVTCIVLLLMCSEELGRYVSRKRNK